LIFFNSAAVYSVFITRLTRFAFFGISTFDFKLKLKFLCLVILDVLGSAKGWSASFLFDESTKKQLAHFRAREDTFSLGVCNGCQLLALLQWIGLKGDVKDDEDEHGIPSVPDVFLDHNQSDRYESRFPTVKIEKSNSIMLKGMDGTYLGVWIAHAEGIFLS